MSNHFKCVPWSLWLNVFIFFPSKKSISKQYTSKMTGLIIQFIRAGTDTQYAHTQISKHNSNDSNSWNSDDVCQFYFSLLLPHGVVWDRLEFLFFQFRSLVLFVLITFGNDSNFCLYWLLLSGQCACVVDVLYCTLDCCGLICCCL